MDYAKARNPGVRWEGEMDRPDPIWNDFAILL
jgi:hypothetical protein